MGVLSWGSLSWGSSAPWLSRILGRDGRNAMPTPTRETVHTHPNLPGNSYRGASFASPLEGEVGPIACAPSLRLTAPPYSPDTHLPVNPAMYLQLRVPEWTEYEQQERVFVVVTAGGRLNVYVDRTCGPVMAALQGRSLEYAS